MEIVVPRAGLAAIEAHALETYPEECCGFLIGAEEGPTRVVAETRRAKNVHPEMRRARYTIDPRDVLAVERELRGSPRRILGFYHSHPDYDATPSEYDASRAWPWYVHAILAVRGKTAAEFRAWTFDESSGECREVSLRVE